jgi:hypothetical protein
MRGEEWCDSSLQTLNATRELNQESSNGAQILYGNSPYIRVERSRAALELENLALRHQIGVLQRSTGKTPEINPRGACGGSVCPASGATGARR